jgi:hypothetical protein
MKFKNTAADYSSTVGTSGKTMGFAPEAQSFLMDMMSDGLYSDKYGSIVREIASNCIDANTESGSTEPVRIVLTKPSSFTAKGEIRFEDNGVGIDPQRIEDIFTLYFASTKRDGNEMIGGFGIGAKSPFAYTDVFRVETWVNGTFYTYLMEKRGEDRTCTLINSEPCDVADHGTKIRIPIQSVYDYEKFVNAVNEQTLLMRPIEVELDGQEYQAADVYEFENFYVAFDRNGDAITGKVALGNVVYPLDLDEFIGYTGYRKPCIIPKLEIGSVMPTMSRESLQLNDEAKEVITTKCQEVIADLQTMADAQVVEEDSLYKVINSQDFSTLPIPNSDKRIPMNWAVGGYGNRKVVKMKACVWSKFPTASVSDITYYAKRILTPYKELSESRSSASQYTFKSQNLSTTGIDVVIGKDNGNRWDTPNLIVRMPGDAKMTAADKDYLLENYHGQRILFIKACELESPATFHKLALSMGFEDQFKGDTGELVDSHWSDVTDFLYQNVGLDVMRVVMDNTTHWDDVKATPEYIEERKEAMKAARTNVTKKARANDSVRVRGLGIHWTGDETIKSMLKRQRDDHRGYVYCTKADIEILKDLHKTSGYQYAPFDDFIRDEFERKNVWLVAVNQKSAKQFAELGIFTSFADYYEKLSARRNNDGAMFMAFFESIQYENRMFIENLCDADPVFGAKFEAIKKLKSDLYVRGMKPAENPADMQFPDTFQIMGNNVGVKFLKKAVKLGHKLAENKPFLYNAFINVKHYVDTRDKQLAEAFGYMYPNAQA